LIKITKYRCDFLKKDESKEYDFGFNINLCMKYKIRNITKDFKL